jgi:hypothetical protein
MLYLLVRLLLIRLRQIQLTRTNLNFKLVKYLLYIAFLF